MIKIGIIGCGTIVEKRHAPEFMNNKDCVITGFTDFNRKRAEACAENAAGSKVYSDYNELLEKCETDAVVVCSSNDTHAKISIDCLNAGKHVLCEKPMAVSVNDAIAMHEASKKAGKLLMIAQNQRFDVVHNYAKQILDGGTLGRIIRFESNFITSGPENWSADSGKNTWFFKKDAARFGAMGDLGIHKLDLVRYFLGEPFSDISAYCVTSDKKTASGEPVEVEDNAVIILRTKSGVVGTINAGWSFYGDCMENSTTLYCENGVVKMYNSLKRDPLIVEYKDGGLLTYNPLTIWGNSTIADRFIDAVKNNKKSPVPPEESVEVIRYLLGCFESCETGRSVKFN